MSAEFKEIEVEGAVYRYITFRHGDYDKGVTQHIEVYKGEDSIGGKDDPPHMESRTATTILHQRWRCRQNTCGRDCQTMAGRPANIKSPAVAKVLRRHSPNVFVPKISHRRVDATL